MYKSILKINTENLFWYRNYFILDAIKPVEDNSENILILNETINKKHEEFYSIKQQISEMNQNSMHLFIQSHENQLQFEKINNTINLLKSWFLFRYWL